MHPQLLCHPNQVRLQALRTRIIQAAGDHANGVFNISPVFFATLLGAPFSAQPPIEGADNRFSMQTGHRLNLVQ